MLSNYDDWKLDTPDNHVNVVGQCKCCGLDVYREEPYFTGFSGVYHYECEEEEE